MGIGEMPLLEPVSRSVSASISRRTSSKSTNLRPLQCRNSAYSTGREDRASGKLTVAAGMGCCASACLLTELKGFFTNWDKQRACFAVDQLEDERTTGDDARSPGQKVPARRTKRNMTDNFRTAGPVKRTFQLKALLWHFSLGSHTVESEPSLHY